MAIIDPAQPQDEQNDPRQRYLKLLQQFLGGQPPQQSATPAAAAGPAPNAPVSLASTQMNPYKQAGDLNALNVRRSFGQQIDPISGKLQGQLDMSALDPQALQEMKAAFQKTAQEDEAGKSAVSAESQRRSKLVTMTDTQQVDAEKNARLAEIEATRKGQESLAKLQASLVKGVNPTIAFMDYAKATRPTKAEIEEDDTAEMKWRASLPQIAKALGLPDEMLKALSGGSPQGDAKPTVPVPPPGTKPTQGAPQQGGGGMFDWLKKSMFTPVPPGTLGPK